MVTAATSYGPPPSPPDAPRARRLDCPPLGGLHPLRPGEHVRHRLELGLGHHLAHVQRHPLRPLRPVLLGSGPDRRLAVASDPGSAPPVPLRLDGAPVV